MTPDLTASIREALGKSYLSEEACRRVAVAVLEEVRDVVPDLEGSVRRAVQPYHDQDAAWWGVNMPGDFFRLAHRAMIDALIQEIERYKGEALPLS